MNRMNFKHLMVVAMLALGLVVFSQTNAMAVSATGSASSEVIVPLDIVFETPLDFGTFTAVTSGTVVVSSFSPFTSPPVATGGVVHIASGTAGRGSFGVFGEPGRSYFLSGDPGVTLSQINPVGPGTMNATLAFRASSAGADGNPTTGVLNTALHTPVTGVPAGGDLIWVGGTLTIPAGQAAGTYKGSYAVTADYN